jgi:hypothetical protein
MNQKPSSCETHSGAPPQTQEKNRTLKNQGCGTQRYNRIPRSARMTLEKKNQSEDRPLQNAALDLVLGEDYVGGVPDGGGDGAAGLRGDDDLERFGVGGEVG